MLWIRDLGEVGGRCAGGEVALDETPRAQIALQATDTLGLAGLLGRFCLVEVYACALDAAAEAIDDLERLLGSGLEILDVGRATVRGALAITRFVLGLCGRLLAVGLVDVASGQGLGL